MRRRVPGDKLAMLASEWNEIADVVNDYAAKRHSKRIQQQCFEVIGRNTTDYEIGLGAPVRLGEFYPRSPLDSITTRLDGYFDLDGFWAPYDATTHGAIGNMLSMGIARVAIPAGESGPVAISGITLARVDGAQQCASPYPKSNVTYKQRMRGASWGLRVLADLGSSWSLVSLGDWQPICKYTLTGGWSTALASATIETQTAIVSDPYDIASWQVTGDSGLCRFDGTDFVVTVPFCDT